MRRINDQPERRAPVALGRWSGPLEGTYDDPAADTTGRPRDEPAPGPAVSGPRSEATREDPATEGPGARASGASANITAPKVSLVRRVGLTKAARRVSLVKQAIDRRDRWAAFAPEPARQPGRVRRWLARLGRVLAHEWTLAALGAVLLAVLMTWPALRHPTRTVPHDLGDPLARAWQLAWSGHALKTEPAGLWHANTFHPERYSFAFADPLLGYAPFGLFGDGVGAALLRYNVVFVLAFALAFFGAYVLVRQLGASRTGAAVAAVAFAFAPWRWGQSGHLNVLSTGGVVLALALLARGHGFCLRAGYRPEHVRPGWALAGWLVAAWQLSLGFAVGLPFVVALVAIGVVSAWRWALAVDGHVRLSSWWATRRRVPLRLLLADLVGAVLFAAAGALLVAPVLRMMQEHPQAWRGRDSHAPPAHGFLIAPAESALWGERHVALRAGLEDPVETSFLLGYALIGLALAGLVYSVWTRYTRQWLFAGAVVTALLPQVFPAWKTLYSPPGLAMWTTLFAGLLAAGAVSAFAERVRAYVAERVPARPGPLLRAAMVLPLVLVLIEGVSANPYPAVSGPPSGLRAAEGPLLVLPTGSPHDEMVMLWSVDRFPAVVNGAGFAPDRLAEVREAARAFPDEFSVELLRELGVRTVVVVKARVGDTPYAAAVQADAESLAFELDIEREETADTVIYRL